MLDRIDHAAVAVAGTGVAAWATGHTPFLPSLAVADATITLPYIDVTLGTLGMAVAGSLIAFAYGTPVVSRAKLFGYAVGGIFIGVWAAQLLPHVLGWRWYEEAMQPPVAGISALLSRWAVPLLVEQGPAIYRRIFNTEVKK